MHTLCLVFHFKKAESTHVVVNILLNSEREETLSHTRQKMMKELEDLRKAIEEEEQSYNELVAM